MATIKSVQKGTVSFAGTDTSKTATITSITIANSVLYFTSSGYTSTQPNYNCVRGAITNGTTLTFTRGSSANPNTLQVEFYVVEFTSGVTVQRGSENLDDLASANVTITSSSLTTSWSTCSWSMDGFTMRRGHFMVHYLSTTTNLALVRGVTGDPCVVEWQVITYDNATVQQVTKSLLTTDTSATSTITSVTTTKTFLEFSYSSTTTGAFENRNCWNSYLTNATTITYSRDTALFNSTTRDYVISISDSIAVQRGEKAVASGTATTTNALTAIVIANSFAHSLNTPGICKNDDSDGDSWNSDKNGIKLKFNSTTELNFARNTSTSNVTCSWEVVEWTAAAAKPVFIMIWIS